MRKPKAIMDTAMLPKLAVKLSKVLAATGAVMPKAEEQWSGKKTSQR